MLQHRDTHKEFFILAPEDSPPLIPEGIYSVIYVEEQEARFQGSQKLYIYFSIVDQGPHFQTILYRAYNNYSPPRKGSAIYNDMRLLYGKRLRKNTKLSTTLFKGRIISVRVRTVIKDYKQRDLPEHMHYSVVDAILSAETSAESSGVL